MAGKPSDADLLGLPSIPKPKKDDPEDVAWALSTAEAMWNRAENADAIKWIRKAAEAASEAEADDRALELAKAAADLQSLIKGGAASSQEPAPTTLQSQAAPPAPPTPVSRPPSAMPPAPSVRPSAMPSPTTPSRPPPPPVASQRAPSVKPPAPPRGPTSAPPVAPAGARPKAPAPARSAPPAPALPKVTPSRAGERRQRRSSSNLTDEAKRAAAAEIAHRVSADPELTKPFAQMPKRASRRRSRPDPEETGEAPAVEEPSNTQLQDRPPDTDPHGLSAEQQRRLSRTEEMDQWPTQSLVDGKELDGSGGFDSGKTRVGAQAYVESSRRVLEPPPGELRASQAVRVIVWRGPDGVHVAPAGTKVAAITVEAILVGLDPNADLATWLKG